MRATAVALIVISGSVTAACGSASHTATDPAATHRGVGAGDGCPSTQTGNGAGYAAVDYVDFVQAFGHNYIAGLRHVAPIRGVDLGERVLTVRCSFSQLNDRTHELTGPPRDGDAAFLTPGTPVYAIRGWSSKCRLAAREDGQLRVFLAYRNGGTVATPEACALTQHPDGAAR